MIRYQRTVDGIVPEQLEGGFFEGWPNRPDPETHLALLRGSTHVVVAFDESTEMVVGFVNAVSDGVLSAFVPLLEVLPTYRGRGLGSDLVRELLDEIGDLYSIDVVCDPDLEAFYRHLGMQPSFGMAIRNYEKQSG